jgi:thiol-disulfide isomerase/thioredoxin
MRLSLPVSALLVFLMLAAWCPSSLSQQVSPSASPTPEPVSLTALPANVMNAELKSARGPSFKLSDYSGKVLVINLWATWALPSREEIPELVKLQKRLSSRGVRVVGLSTESPTDSVAVVREFVRNYQIQYKIGWLTPEVSLTLMQGLDYVPQTYVISARSRIVRRFIGFNSVVTPKLVKEAVEEALKESGVGRALNPVRN